MSVVENFRLLDIEVVISYEMNFYGVQGRKIIFVGHIVLLLNTNYAIRDTKIIL